MQNILDFEKDYPDDDDQDCHGEICLGVEAPPDKRIDDPGIGPHFAIFLFIPKFAI